MANVIKSAYEWATKASAVLPLMIRSMFGGSAIPPPNKAADYLKLYSIDPWLYSAVWMIANVAAKAPMQVKIGDDLTDEHPLLDLLNAPNENQSAFDFLESTFTYLELTGEAFWEKVFPGKLCLRPVELHNLRPDRVELQTREDATAIGSYKYSIGGAAPIEFDPDAIVPIRYFNPTDDWRGHSSFKPLENTVIAGNYASRWIKRFFRRYGIGEGALETAQRIGGPEQKRLGASWSSRYDEKEDKTPVLPTGLGYKVYSHQPKESGMLELYKFLREEKLGVCGVPPVLVGLVEYARYANYELQLRAFNLITLVPKLIKLEGAINRHLMPAFWTSKERASKPSRRPRFQFDKRTIGFIDMGAFVDVLTNQYDTGGLTPNEIIKLTGLGHTYDEGDEHYTGERRQKIGQEVAPEPEEPDPTPMTPEPE